MAIIIAAAITEFVLLYYIMYYKMLLNYNFELIFKKKKPC